MPSHIPCSRSRTPLSEADFQKSSQGVFQKSMFTITAWFFGNIYKAPGRARQVILAQHVVISIAKE
jgi:hypothetical protein